MKLNTYITSILAEYIKDKIKPQIKCLNDHDNMTACLCKAKTQTA